MLLSEIVSEVTMDALGWTLLHFIWQGALLALLAAFFLTLTRNASANLRYAVACSVLLLMLLLPLSTFWYLQASPDSFFASAESDLPTPSLISEVVSSPTVSVQKNLSVESSNYYWSAYWREQMVRQVAPWLPWCISLWLTGVLFFSLRLLGGWQYARSLKSRGTQPLRESIKLQLNETLQQFSLLRPVTILESALVQVPTALGWLQPVIILPTSVLTGLTTEQLRAVVAHELAHLRRHDYVINLLQSVVETLLFYHPAVWWLSQRIRDERENCCDDIAVALHGDAVAYARTLVKLENLRADAPPLALAATGGKLLSRILRLVQTPPSKTNPLGLWLATGIVLALVITVGLNSGFAQRFTDPQQELSVKYPAGSAEEQAAQAMNTIIKTLKGRNFEMKGEVVTALNQIRTSGTIEPLLAALKEPSEHTREKAAWVLGNLEDDRAVDGLVQALQTGDWRGQHTVAWALGMIRDRRAVAPLIESLKTGNPDARHGAAWALGNLGDESAVEALIVCLKDKAADVRHGAAWALGMIGDPRALEPLRAASNDSDGDVRAVAQQALAQLTRR